MARPLAHRTHEHPDTGWVTMTARDISVCIGCFEAVEAGNKMCWNIRSKRSYHYECHGLTIERMKEKDEEDGMQF